MAVRRGQYIRTRPIGCEVNTAELGRLGGTVVENRRYLREIDRHNDAVAEHNAALAEMQRVYAEYSALVDTHNALVDSANVLQRRAVQEGIQLSTPAEP